MFSCRAPFFESMVVPSGARRIFSTRTFFVILTLTLLALTYLDMAVFKKTVGDFLAVETRNENAGEAMTAHERVAHERTGHAMHRQPTWNGECLDMCTTDNPA